MPTPMTGKCNSVANNLPFDRDMEYEAVIGLEVHVQLDTNSKMFTRVGTGFGKPPNTLTNPVVMGLPGALPVNREAIEKSIKSGFVAVCKIADVCKWDRKNISIRTRNLKFPSLTNRSARRS